MNISLRVSWTYTLFFLLAVSLLAAGLYLFGTSYINEISVFCLGLTVAVFSLFYSPTRTELSTIDTSVVSRPRLAGMLVRPFFTIETVNFEKIATTTFFILAGLLVFGIVNLFLVTSRIDASTQSISIVNGISVVSLIITQIGGWFFQSCMIYMFSFILGGKQSFNNYLTLVALGYIGFFIVSVLTILINIYFIPSGIDPEDFRMLLETSYLHGILGKAGEYWTLTLISFAIYTYEESFSISKSLLVAVLPSFGLLFFKIFFASIT